MDFNHLVKICLVFLAFLFISNAYAATQAPAIVCDQAYALCTSAACIPDPKQPGHAICDCVVNKGKSAGFTSCEQRKPFVDTYKAMHVVSTFSFEQLTTKKSLTCSKGMPWNNCVDMPCTVDPQNTNRAICNCKIDNTQAFFTFGGNCDSNTCATGFWSGATQGAASNALRNALDKAENPVSFISCPVNTANTVR
ncbi:MAG TPA: hypothetical protein VHZ76_07670 [Gammaproteobacteria bacterium]|nr:hypothetical protein [Gammaproteobacteria bacterium]